MNNQNAQLKIKNTHGGAGRGGGRKLGSVSQRTKALRAISDEAIFKGITPLEAMLDNMRFYHSEAHRLLATLLQDHTKMRLAEKLEMLKSLCNFRTESQKCAEGAAPYVHARLSAVSVSGEVTQRHMLPDGLELAKAMEIYRESLKGRSAPQMKTIEHQTPATKEQGE